MTWQRVRFKTSSANDPRPVTFPPPGPYWVTGYGGDEPNEYATIVAFFPEGCMGEIKEFWPEAETEGWDGFDLQECSEITFTSRFPKPDWWHP